MIIIYRKGLSEIALFLFSAQLYAQIRSIKYSYFYLYLY